MGSFDAAGVIQAAATSNLGVVSLIVLVLAFLAWRFFQRSSDNVKLIAFAMMFLGAAGFVAAVMLAGGDTAGDPPDAAQAETPAPETSNSPAPAASAAQDPVDVTGDWYESDGYSYRIAQDGSAISYVYYYQGARLGTGDGTISGRLLSYRFESDDKSRAGTCEAEVAAGGNVINGTCVEGGRRWEFTIER